MLEIVSIRIKYLQKINCFLQEAYKFRLFKLLGAELNL